MRAVTGGMLGLAMLAAPIAVQAQSTAVPAAIAPAGLSAATPEIDAIFSRWMADNHVPGMVYGLVSGGRLVLVKGLGVQDLTAKRPVTPDSLFRIASMTKAFTALSILSLRDKGLLALDDPAEKYVPELRGWTYPTSDSPKITISDLLHHVGGFVTDDPWGDRQQVLAQEDFTRLLAAGVPFTRAPEMQYEYSNLGFAILGRVIANVTGAPYTDYVGKTLLAPLGMTASGFDVLAHPQDKRAIGYRWENGAWAEEPTMKDGAFNAMGGLEVSANDYAKWVGFVLSAWPPRDGAETGPVRRSTVRQVAQGLNFQSVNHRPGNSGGAACPGALAYGMGWRVVQDCDFGLTMNHGGGFPGYGSHVLLLPEFGVGLFALTNRTYSGPSPATWDAAALLLAKGLLKRPEAPVSADLGTFYGLTRDVWRQASVAPLAGKVAMNFAMDRTEANWARLLAEAKARAGTCDTTAPIVPGGAMTGTFSWTCQGATVRGELLLAPTRPITVQALRFAVEGKD